LPAVTTVGCGAPRFRRRLFFRLRCDTV
jgi:hypothetical protein